MLKGISPYLSPDLLKILCEMGHGDELLLADAHFPGGTMAKRLLRADGLSVTQMLDAILPLFELDQHSDPLIMMQPDGGDSIDPALTYDYLQAIHRHAHSAKPPVQVARDDFYNRARSAYAVLMTGELRAYGNLILRKGVTPIPAR